MRISKKDLLYFDVNDSLIAQLKVEASVHLKKAILTFLSYPPFVTKILVSNIAFQMLCLVNFQINFASKDQSNFEKKKFLAWNSVRQKLCTIQKKKSFHAPIFLQTVALKKCIILQNTLELK